MSEARNGRERIRQGPLGAILALAKARGISKVSETEGVYHLPIDDRWNVYVNPHDEPHEIKAGVTTHLEPGFFLIEFNGWPASVFHPLDAEIVFVAGEAANAETFRDAILAAIDRAERAAAEREPEDAS